jgi:hypothetical protein
VVEVVKHVDDEECIPLLERGYVLASAEFELVALRTEREEVSVGAAVHLPSRRPPAGHAVTVPADQRVAGQGTCLLDPPAKLLGALVVVHAAACGALADCRVVGSSRAAS